MFYEDWYGELDLLRRTLKKAGLPFASLHADKNIGSGFSDPDPETRAEALRRFEKNCLVAAEAGAETVVLHLWGPPVSDGCLSRNFRMYPSAEKIARGFGLRLAVENIACRFSDPLTVMLRAAETFGGAGFTFDTRMAAFHGQLEDMYGERALPLWRGGRIIHLHYSDYSGEKLDWNRIRVILHPGEGLVKTGDLAECLRRNGYRGCAVLESPVLAPDGAADFKKLNRSLALLREALL